MNARASAIYTVLAIVFAGAVIFVAAREGTDKREHKADPADLARTASAPSSTKPSATAHGTFQPPPLSAIPNDDFGQMVRLGSQIFEDPSHYAPDYVGNNLRCSNCHMDGGRLAGSAPMWAAYVSYPAYRSKNGHVNTFAERLQGCFRFSMNGKAPPLGDKVLVALETYAYWMAKGAPIDPKIAGRGYPKLEKSALSPDYGRGQAVYANHCALCHGTNGDGQVANDGSAGFPALWGPDSFNWGAGMGSLQNAAAFIRANMPLGQGGTLSIQDAWDVAMFMDSHERPQDPRFTGSVAEARQRFHNSPNSTYGTVVNGHLLGSDSVPSGGSLRSQQAGNSP